MRNDALVLVTKEFDGQEVQSRFMPPLSGKQADEVALAFLRDASALAFGALPYMDVWCAIEAEDHVVREIMPPTVKIVHARGYTRGERLAGIVDDVSSGGYRRMVLADGDCVGIDFQYLHAALVGLVANEAVLGPTAEGGYGLVGVTKSIARLFLDIDQHPPQLLRQTLLRAQDLQLNVGVLPTCPTVRNLADLAESCARGELAHHPNLAESVQALVNA